MRNRDGSSADVTAVGWHISPGTDVRLADLDHAYMGPFAGSDAAKRQAKQVSAANLERLRVLQERLYVDGRYAVLLVLQGMDTSGKDGTVRHLSRGLDLIGAELTNFVRPTSRELAYDFLWRIHQRVPPLGRIGIFNRSHYEDVLVPLVHGLIPHEVIAQRYRQINDFERMLVENHTTVLKCFLHISKKEQRGRLQARVDNREKWWKFDPADVEARGLWEAYQEAYEATLSTCSTAVAPWHVIPADHKWYRNYAVGRLLMETLEGLDLQLPEPMIDMSTVRIA
jgi:PPK2 family polyphosphate:nucleotide phosphotransferase